jgi:hypothetical protein
VNLDALMPAVRAIKQDRPPGFLLFNNRRSCGWSATLPKPTDWRPGTSAVSLASGETWVATGGNNHDGATEWRRK